MSESLLLRIQYRQPEGLSDVMSVVHYEGEVINHGMDIKPTCPCSLLCIWRDWQDAAALVAPFPADPEAMLVACLYKRLRKLFPAKAMKVLSPYAEQLVLIVSYGVPDTAVSTVDSFQGNETDIVLISLARWFGLGFLCDRRRMNVATSRARFLQIILANDALGQSSSTQKHRKSEECVAGERWWFCQRELMRRINAEYVTDALTRWSPDGTFKSHEFTIDSEAGKICKQLREGAPILGASVRSAVSRGGAHDMQQVFGAYQLSEVGALAATDVSAEGCHVAVDLQNILLPTDKSDSTAPAPSISPGLPLMCGDPGSHDRFALVVVRNMGSLFRLSMLDVDAAQRKAIQKDNRFFLLC